MNTGAAPVAVAVEPLMVETTTAHATPPSSCPVISPMMTRSTKKRKAASPASPVDCTAFIQVDGLSTSPPPSPAASAISDGEEVSHAYVEPYAQDKDLPLGLTAACSLHHHHHQGHTTYLHTRALSYISTTCFAGCHRLSFKKCSGCHDKQVNRH